MGHPRMTAVSGTELVTGAEIGRRLGVSRERVRQWAANERLGFPAPTGRVGQSTVWEWALVTAWAANRKGTKDG